MALHDAITAHFRVTGRVTSVAIVVVAVVTVFARLLRAITAELGDTEGTAAVSGINVAVVTLFHAGFHMTVATFGGFAGQRARGVVGIGRTIVALFGIGGLSEAVTTCGSFTRQRTSGIVGVARSIVTFFIIDRLGEPITAFRQLATDAGVSANGIRVVTFFESAVIVDAVTTELDDADVATTIARGRVAIVALFEDAVIVDTVTAELDDAEVVATIARGRVAVIALFDTGLKVSIAARGQLAADTTVSVDGVRVVTFFEDAVIVDTVTAELDDAEVVATVARGRVAIVALLDTGATESVAAFGGFTRQRASGIVGIGRPIVTFFSRVHGTVTAHVLALYLHLNIQFGEKEE
jgi:hypothetical protein